MKVLRFTASWCQPCKMLAKTLEDVDTQIPIDIVQCAPNNTYDLSANETVVLGSLPAGDYDISYHNLVVFNHLGSKHYFFKRLVHLLYFRVLSIFYYKVLQY